MQELFDSMHFSGNSAALNLGAQKNSSDAQYSSLSATLEQDLQIFAKRLAKKLQKATHVVLELRDFFRTNITKVLLQQHLQTTEYGDENDDVDTEADDTETDEDDEESGVESEEDEFDVEIDELDGLVDTAHGARNLRLYLHSCIQAFQSNANNRQIIAESNYNKQQIQILNYLKTDLPSHKSQYFQHFEQTNYFMDEGSFEARANAYILEKLQTLKNVLMKSDFSIELTKLSTNVRSTASTTTTTNAKLKFLGNHFKHIYFLSRSDHAEDLRTRYYEDNYFQQLYVTSIKNKYVFLLLDVGSAMNMELLELTKALGNFFNKTKKEVRYS